MQSIFITLFVLLISVSVFAEKNSTSGMLDFNVYPYLSDVDTDSVFSLNAAASLANGFSYFSLLNFYNQAEEAAVSETVSFYTEQNIRWEVDRYPIFDLTYQANFRSGEDNDKHRLGFRWRLHDTPALKSLFDKLSLNYAINFHLLQLDDDPSNAWQIEHSYFMRFPWLSERLYLAGFLDHNINETLPSELPSDPIVLEAQLGYRIVENLHLALEYRLNEYRRSDVNNIAVGMQYKILW